MQHRTVLESITADGFHTIGDVYLLQTGALFEYTTADLAE